MTVIGNEWLPLVNGSWSTPTRRRLRLVALIVATIGVLALAAAAFVLSYPGARDTALTAGVSKDLARIYPGVFDAVLVIACAGALSLRGVRRAYAWLVILVLTAAIAAADATHAMAVTLPKRPMEATVAVVPWAVLLIGFTLLYAIARQARPTRTPPLAPAAAEASATPLPAPPAPGNGTPPGQTVPLNELLKARSRADNPSADQPSADRPGTAQPSADQPSADRPGADLPGADRPSAAQASADLSGADRPSADRPSADRSGGDRSSADRSSPDPRVPAQPRPAQSGQVVLTKFSPAAPLKPTAAAAPKPPPTVGGATAPALTTPASAPAPASKPTQPESLPAGPPAIQSAPAQATAPPSVPVK